MTDELTADDARKEELAAEAADRIKKGQHWTDWMLIGDGLMVGRRHAMFLASTNQPKGKGYAKAFSAWMTSRAWAFELDSPTRNDLFWCVDHRSEIEIWRDTLAQNERVRLNHPSAMKRRFEATHRVKAADDNKPSSSPMATLKARLEEAEDQLMAAKKQIVEMKSHGDGSVFDLKKDTAVDIAKTIAANVTYYKLTSIQRELAKAIAEAKKKEAHAG
jgi:hypothetical protein